MLELAIPYSRLLGVKPSFIRNRCYLVPLPMVSELLKLALLNAAFRRAGRDELCPNQGEAGSCSEARVTRTGACEESLEFSPDERHAKKQRRDCGVESDLEVKLLPHQVSSGPQSLQRSTPTSFLTTHATSAPRIPSPYHLGYSSQNISSLPQALRHETE
jgi:hypothetical protein